MPAPPWPRPSPPCWKRTKLEGRPPPPFTPHLKHSVASAPLALRPNPSDLVGMRQPTLFIPHGGGPCFFMDPSDPDRPHCDPMWQPMQDYLAGIVATLPERPGAILLVSGHWEESRFTVHDGERPGLLFDYHGFPPHTYALRWDAPGAPALARDRKSTRLNSSH